MQTGNDERFIRFSAATESIQKALQKYKNECLEAYGLRSMHLMTMIRLYKRGGEGMTSVDLAKSCAVDKAFVSRVTGELRLLGYLESADGGESAGRRRNRLVLTQRGREVMQNVYRMLDRAVDRITEGVSGRELETFYGVLARFDDNLMALAAESGEGRNG